MTEYQRAIQIDPHDVSAHIGFGNALYGLGKLDQALAEYRRAVELYPSFAVGHVNLGNTLADLHRTGDAIDEYRLAIKLDPGNAYSYPKLLALLWTEAQAAPASDAKLKLLDEACSILNTGRGLKPDGADPVAFMRDLDSEMQGESHCAPADSNALNAAPPAP